jgi:uncharacterized protein
MIRNKKFPSASAGDEIADRAPDQTGSYSAGAKKLIRTQRTMILSTCGTGPWAAPVYYVHVHPGFYFFSSPKSRHIEEGLAAAASAAIFADSDRWEEIQGLQMTGSIAAVTRRSEQVKAVARFLLKFPFARPFLTADASHQDPPHVADRVQLYVFSPQQVYYLNNRLGFGKRVPVSLSR